MPRLLVRLLASVGIASSASAVTMDWAPVGAPGNACDPQAASGVVPGGCFGAVGYSYNISTYEVTNGQYAEFLNAKAASDPLALYNTGMGSGVGGIARSGVSGSFAYSAITGRADKPVSFVSRYDALRFANWMSNGQGSGDTETGAYTLLGGTPTPSNGGTVTRSAGANIHLPSEDEWYKAAYYDAVSASYFAYPTRSDTRPGCSGPTATSNSANCQGAIGDFADTGSYPGSASPFGTFDQGGNVNELTDTTLGIHGAPVVRGGHYNSSPFNLGAFNRATSSAADEGPGLGFRLAMIPEPGTGLLVIAGLLGLAGSRRMRAA